MGLLLHFSNLLQCATLAAYRVSKIVFSPWVGRSIHFTHFTKRSVRGLLTEMVAVTVNMQCNLGWWWLFRLPICASLPKNHTEKVNTDFYWDHLEFRYNTTGIPLAVVWWIKLEETAYVKVPCILFRFITPPPRTHNRFYMTGWSRMTSAIFYPTEFQELFSKKIYTDCTLNNPPPTMNPRYIYSGSP
jgi:hypothetical protein